MSLLKKPNLGPEHEGVTIQGKPAPMAEKPEYQKTAENAQGVQTKVQLQSALPEDPARAAARMGDGGFRPGAYCDSSGTTYFVMQVADGHVAFARIDGGHPTQLRVLTVSEFADKRYRLVLPDHLK